MKSSALLCVLCSAAFVAAPVAQAASAKKKPADAPASKSKKTPAKSAARTQAKPAGKPFAKSKDSAQEPLMPPSSLKMVGVDAGAQEELIPSAATAQETGYEAFKKCLDEQVRQNRKDSPAAMMAVLKATDDEFAVEAWMERAAKEGNLAALQYVGNNALRLVKPGETQKAEYREAYQKVRKAAGGGFVPAMVNSYLCMKRGIGTPKDEAGAQKYMLQACRNKDFALRFMWLQDTGRLESWASREKPEVKTEMERGNFYVLDYLAGIAPTPEEQIKCFTEAAEKGSADAVLVLSSLCAKTAPEKSYELLRKAAEMQSVKALFNLGLAVIEPDMSSEYVRRAGIIKSEPEGILLLRVAAMLGHAGAHYWLANAYYEGSHSLPRDLSRAYRHFSEGFHCGDVPCMASTALLLATGQGVKAQPKEGAQMLLAAANRGYPYAVILLAYVQYEGIGVPADGKAAAEKLLEAATMRQPEAYIALAYMYEKGGAGLEAKPEQAARYLRYAAMDMGEEEVQKRFEQMKKEGWHPHP